jgi:hypothetical protein
MLQWNSWGKSMLSGMLFEEEALMANKDKGKKDKKAKKGKKNK